MKNLKQKLKHNFFYNLLLEMKKEITNIFINTGISEKTESNNRVYSFRFDTPPIVIKNKANLKIANISHVGSGHSTGIIIIRIDGIMSDNNRYLGNDGATPTIIATTLDNNRNYTEENDIPLIKQTINSIKLIPNIMFMNNGLASITIVGGSGYTNGTYDLIFSGGTFNATYGGTHARATATISGNAISSVNITYRGFGYLTAPTITLPASAGAGTSGTLTAVLTTDNSCAAIYEFIPNTLNFCISLKIEEEVNE